MLPILIINIIIIIIIIIISNITKAMTMSNLLWCIFIQVKKGNVLHISP